VLLESKLTKVDLLMKVNVWGMPQIMPSIAVFWCSYPKNASNKPECEEAGLLGLLEKETQLYTS
jgi:hypothetical protein